MTGPAERGDLQSRIERLEDVEAIRRLKGVYCRLADEAYGNKDRWADLVALFCEEAWLDFGAYGRYEGKGEIFRFFTEVSHPFLSYASHMVSNPIVDVDGRCARGSWYFFCPCTERSTGMALWIHGRYLDEFVKVDGRWLWASLTARFDFVSPFDRGWAEVCGSERDATPR